MKKTRIVLSFPPEKVEEPVIYHLIKDHDLMVNILRATIDPGKQGRMVVELSGDDNRLSQALDYLDKAGVNAEHLSREIRHIEERCMSCTACVPICPTGAFDVNRDSWLVSFDSDKCVACLSCLQVCVYKAVEVSLS